MRFGRKIGDFDPDQFGKDPFRDVESSAESAPEGDSRWERAGEIVGYVLVGLVLGGIGAVVVRIALDAWF